MTNSNFQVVTMNMRDGSVQGHAAGCADLKRGLKKFSEPDQANYPLDVTCKHDAFLDYNADFIEEEDDFSNCYDINWLPCAKHVPAEVSEPTVTVKVGRKWTYVYAADGSLLAEVRNDSSAAVLAALQA